MRSSVASAPRSTTPPVNGSISYSRSLRFVAAPPASATDACGTKRGSKSSSTSCATGSSVTTQAWPTVAAIRPATLKPPPPCRLTSKLASRRGRSRRPATFAIAARVCESAVKSNCSPDSGTSSTATGKCHGLGEPGLASSMVSARCLRISLDRERPARWQRYQRLHLQVAPRRRGYIRQDELLLPPRCLTRRYCAPARSQALGGRSHPAPPDRRPDGGRTPHRTAASAAEPPYHQPPSPEGSHPDPGRRHRKAAVQVIRGAPTCRKFGGVENVDLVSA